MTAVDLIPERLEKLAILSIATWIKSQVHVLSQILYRTYDEDADASFSLLARHVEDIREYLERGVFRAAFNQVAKEIIRILTKLIDNQAVNVKESLRVTYLRLPIFTCYSAARMVEVVFCKKLTCVEIPDEFCCWSARFQPENTFIHKTHLLTGLNELELKYYRKCCEQDIIRFISKLKLRLLSLAGSDCDNNIMSCISQNEFIEELDLNHSKLDDSKIAWIMQLHHLRIIRLSKTNVTNNGYKTLLLFCKNLEYVEGCELADVLEVIESSPEYEGQVFGITRYCGSDATLSKLQRIVRMCPLLCDVEIYSIDYPEDNVQALTALKSLQKLTLRQYDFYADRVWEVLHKIGHNITELKMHRSNEFDKDAILFINSVCPNLETLLLRRISFSHERQDIPEIKSNIVNFCGRLFPVLKRIQISCAYIKPTERLLEILSVVLSNCVNVECIEINTGHDNFTGEVMLDYLDKNPMKFLETLEIRGSQSLPQSVVDQFFNKCMRLQQFKCKTH